MSYETIIHPMQTLILRELLFTPAARYTDLQLSSGLESDHFKFHLKRLVESGYVTKNSTEYALTLEGKEYANKLDTDAGTIERQPKSAVILVVERTAKDGKEYLIQERLKHPYFGFWGFPSGKVRWGESILTTAVRELHEETGLTATFHHCGIYHERDIQVDNPDVIEDKIFHIMFATEPTGTLVESFQGGRNAWRTIQATQREPKRYKSFDKELEIALNDIPFTESVIEYGDEF